MQIYYANNNNNDVYYYNMDSFNYALNKFNMDLIYNKFMEFFRNTTYNEKRVMNIFCIHDIFDKM